MVGITAEEIRKALDALNKVKIPADGRMRWNTETDEVEKS